MISQAPGQDRLRARNEGLWQSIEFDEPSGACRVHLSDFASTWVITQPSSSRWMGRQPLVMSLVGPARLRHTDLLAVSEESASESPRRFRRLHLLRKDEVCEFEEVPAGVA